MEFFEHFIWWAHELWNFTAFFWENTYGKSTLTKIFRSLGSNDCTQISELKTIAPTISWVNQEVEIKYLDNISSSECFIRYNSISGTWVDNWLNGNIFIFDNDFIHKHLITWIDITHWNREKFTDFVLWEDAVLSINEIEDLKKRLLLSKNLLKSILPPFLIKESNVVKINDFLALNVTDDEVTLQKQKETIKQKILNLSSSENIVKLPSIEKFTSNFLSDLNNVVSTINKTIIRDFQDVTNTTLENIKAHIYSHTNQWPTIDAWIGAWFLEHRTWDNCPFCWQDTSEAELLKDFSRFFNQAYSTFSKSILEDLRNSVNTLYKDTKPDVWDYLLWIVWNLKKYLAYDNSFIISDDILKKIDEINALEKSFIQNLSDEKERIKSFCTDKKQAPHKSFIPIIISENIISNYASLLEKVDAVYNDLLPLINSSNELKKYHQELISKWIAEERKLLDNKFSTIERYIARIQQSSQCSLYIGEVKNIDELGKSIQTKEQELERNQSLYLDKYFVSINEIYIKFWNRNFELQKAEWPKRWNRKTYFLWIKYKWKDISESDFPKLMSESEKRSLAFAVFLARIQQLEDDKKSNAIIVLDDPVVSFDQTRIDETVRYLRAHISPKFRQLIILTHYENFMRSIQEQYKNFPLSFYCEIEKWWSYVSRDKKHYTHSLESTYYDRLMQFANGLSNEIDLGFPRVFMEKYIESRFRKQLLDAWINLNSDLKEKIDVLPIEEFKRIELESFKNEFNDPHHNFANPIELENFRTSVRNLMNQLYDL